jgi:predicted ester cyclase
MTTDIHLHNKRLIGRLRAALYDCDARLLSDELQQLFAADCAVHLAFPFEDLTGPEALFTQVYQPLLAAVPDLERRDFIVMGGPSNEENWVGCAGYYTGVFARPWLDIPPTGQAIHMRHHEFFRIRDDRIVEMQALWDIPSVMMQARAWPMAPSLGVEWLVPGPATQDGILDGPYDQAAADASVQLVLDMVAGLHRSGEGVEAMGLTRYWHPKMHWYGPAGIGTARRMHGFRTLHQIPFLKAMPDRRALMENGVLFGDRHYVGFTAWPGMVMNLTGDGWLGIAPAGQRLTMRSLDFWRCEEGLLRENWVLVDLLDVYHQLGVDVFTRMRELTAPPLF